VRLGPAGIRFTGRAEGDLRHDTGRRPAVLDRPWTWLHQVHGDGVVVVTAPGAGAGAEGDGLVSADPGAALAVFTADCAPVALASGEGVIGLAHAGWRGLLAGVVERTVAEMRALGATSIEAALGPCIHAECYAFAPADLDRAAGLLGTAVRATTPSGAPALDLQAAVAAVLDRAGVELAYDEDACTACAAGDYYSHRARAETQRQATLVWLEPAAQAAST
jgi:YfiH family protein